MEQFRQHQLFAASAYGINYGLGQGAIAKEDPFVALAVDVDKIHPLRFSQAADEGAPECIKQPTADRMGRAMAESGDHERLVSRTVDREPEAARILPRSFVDLFNSDLTMSSNPRITVFIPVFNREDYVCAAINSMLAQQYKDFEILVVDDGSTDRTPERVEAYSDPRVRLARSDENQGIPASRNRGLELARGDYIALLDSDDYSYPERLGIQVDYLDQHPDIVQVGSGCTLMNDNGQLLKRVRRHPLRPEDVDAHLLFHCSLINRTIMARTEVLRSFGYDTDFPRCQDYDLHVRLAEEHRMANLPNLLVCGREHAGRITKNTRNLGRDRKMIIQARVLDQLAVSYSNQDLLWHFLLSQKPDPEVTSAKAYLDWAEHWLNELQQANQRVKRFQPAAFRRALGAMWAVACWHYAGGAGNSLLRRLLSSRLSLGLPGNLNPITWARMLSQPRRAPDLDLTVPERLID